MHKKTAFLTLLILSFALTACSNNNNTVSNSISSSSGQTSVSESRVSSTNTGTTTSTSTSSSLKTSASATIDEDDEAIEAVPVDDDEDEPVINSAFLEDYDQIEGNYICEGDKSFTMTIESFGCEAQILISQKIDEANRQEWELTATIKDGKPIYSNCCLMKIDDTNPNDPQYEAVYLDGSGFFEAQEGKLLWTGAADDSCKKCVFIKK